MVGGGPLMDLIEMNMLEYAFYYAKKKRKKTLLFGCGWGPLKNNKTIRIAGRLVELSDYTIFRDETSLIQCLKIFPQFKNKVASSIDPAIFACHFFMQEIRNKRSEKYIAINFRDVSLEGNNYSKEVVPKECFVNIIKDILFQTDIPIRLIPMHNFFIGGDDRIFLNSIKHEISSEKIIVEHAPMSLYETMELFYHAKVCVGMRFHSILLQTMLNGNNYILDYTDPENGKIIGLMKQLKLESFYRERYCSLYDSDNQLKINLRDNNRYLYFEEDIDKAQKKYAIAL